MIVRSATTTAALLFTSATLLHAQTWDGGGTDNNFTTPANWNPNAVPANNGTANLIFAGTVDPTPLVNVNYDVLSVTFNNTANAFNIGPPGGSTLTIRGGGVTNNNGNVQIFFPPVTFATGSSITAAVGNLNFVGPVTIGTNTVTVSGGSNTDMDAIIGTGVIVKNGTGILSIAPSGNQTYGLTINAGTVRPTSAVTFSGASADVSVPGGSFLPTTSVNFVSGASFNVPATGTFILSDLRTLSVQSASSATFGASLTTSAGSTYRVTGTGSAMTSPGLTVQDGASLEVLNNSSFTSPSGAVVIGSAGTHGSLLVDGTGSTFTTSGSSTISAPSGGNSTTSLTFSNGSVTTLNSATLSLGNAAGTTATMKVTGGARVTAGTCDLSPFVGSGFSDVFISGTGSKLTALFNVADFNIGSGGGNGSAKLTVADGGELDLRGPLALNTTGTLTINGGIVTMAPTEEFTNNGQLNFIRGRFSPGVGLNIGGGISPLGTSLTLQTGKELIVPSSRVTTVGPAGILVLDGGILSTGTLTNSGGAIDFRRGLLRITGSGGLTIGSSGPLGGNVSLPPGAALEQTGFGVTGLTVFNGALLSVDGGSVLGRSFSISGTMLVNAGTATSLDGGIVNNGGQLVVSRELSTGGSLLVNSGGRLELANNTGRLSGAGSVANSGLLTGSGTFACTVTNTSSGRIRGEAGKTLYFSGTFNPNGGELQLQGGTLDFLNAVTNGSGALISGRGAFSTAGLTNNGVMAFSGGNTDIRGDVTNASGARVVTSGAGSVTTFFDDVVHNGTEIFTGVSCSTVFFGAQSGSGSYTGSGTVYFIGDLRPGNSPAIVTCAPEAVFAPSSGVNIEIGGLTPGTRHDKLVFTSAASPQVEWNGSLTVSLINGFAPAAGQSFDVLDFDSARDSGAFTTVTLPALPNGLAWDTADLYNTGTLRVVSSTGITFAQWAATILGNPAASPGGDHDNDGYTNGVEFALGLFPPQPGAILPDGGFHIYPDGQRLRLFFTRPLDRTGLTLRIQAADNLTDWTDLAVSTHSAPFTGPGFVSENRAHPLNEPGLVEVRDLLTSSAAQRRQIRLLITLTP